ncbi:MAG: hypothetical protein V1676_05430 [Candidatus Diapherotrites archaeon]
MKSESVCMAMVNPSTRLAAEPQETRISRLCEHLEKGGIKVTDSAIALGKRCRK